MDLSERVMQAISSNIEKKIKITPNSQLIEDLQVDSFGKLMIIAALEDEFNISIDESDFKDVHTVNDIISKLEERYDEG